MKIKIWLTMLSVVVLGLSWKVYCASREHSVLCSFVHDFTVQADVFEHYRAAGLNGAPPSVAASYLKYVTEFQLPVWSVGSIGQPGSAGTKYFDAAPQRTQYYVTHLKSMVDRERSAAIADLITYLRRTTGQDLGDDPQKWIKEYASKK